MKKGVVLGVAYVVAAVSLIALSPVHATAQAREGESQERRRNIRYMEGVLVQAVRVGAEQVGKELERLDPTGVAVLLGTPRARGFVLEGHGVFFDVEVPDMNGSVIASVIREQRERLVGNAADSLRQAMRAMPEGQSMQQVQTALQFLTSAGATTKDAASIKDAASMPSTPQGVVVPAILTDPRAVYRQAVIDTVVGAMLGYSVQMSLGPDEWLTVAARGSDPGGPLQGVQEVTTITVRVKGSDLAVYHSDPARRAEIREKVKAEAKVF